MSERLQTVEVETGVSPVGSVIWLHGLGADGHDFEPIVPELAANGVALRFVLPHAPVRQVTLNGGMPMRAWFDIVGLDRAARQDEAGIRESQTQVELLIARENERGVPAERIVLAGFSQGGAIALQTGLRHAARLAAIIGLSTYLPLGDTLGDEAAPANRATPILLAHGTEDPLVDPGLGEGTRDLLVQQGYEVGWKTYPMPHAVCPEEIADIRAFMATAFAGA